MILPGTLIGSRPQDTEEIAGETHAKYPVPGCGQAWCSPDKTILPRAWVAHHGRAPTPVVGLGLLAVPAPVCRHFSPVLPAGAGLCRGSSLSGVARSAIRRTRPQGALLTGSFHGDRIAWRAEDGPPARAGAATPGCVTASTAGRRVRGNGAAAAARAVRFRAKAVPVSWMLPVAWVLAGCADHGCLPTLSVL